MLPQFAVNTQNTQTKRYLMITYKTEMESVLNIHTCIAKLHSVRFSLPRTYPENNNNKVKWVGKANLYA